MAKSKHPAAHRRRSPYLHLPFAYRVRRKAFYRFLAVGSAVLAAIVLLPVVMADYFTDEPSGQADADEATVLKTTQELSVASSLVASATSEPAPAEVPGSAELSLESILDTYRNATGLREVQSLLLHGHYTEDGRRFEMKLAAKAPDLVRKSLSDQAIAMVCSYNGKVATIQVGKGDGPGVTQPIEDVLYQKALILEGAFLSLADIGFELLAPRYGWQPDQTYEGKPCWTVVSQLAGSPQISHLIDPETGFELVRYLDVAVEDQRHQISMHFGDFRPSGAFHLPHSYQLKVDGNPRGQARIDTYQRNPGLMPWMF